MKNFASLILVAGAVIGNCGIGQAQLPATAEALNNAPFVTSASSRVAASPTDFRLEAAPRVALSVGTGELVARSASNTLRAAASRVATSAESISGYYVGKYSTLASNSFDGGSTMQIVPDAEGDSVTIKYFWSGCDVRAHLDAANGTITIPRQHIADDNSYGQLDIAVINTDGTPDYSNQIAGTVAADGSIDFSATWWGIFAQTGANKDKFVAAYYNLSLSRPTGQFTYKNSAGNDVGYYVLIEQTSKNMLTVSNIFNRGYDIEIELKRNRTAEINGQTAFINGSGAWTLIRCVEFNEAGNLTKYSNIIETAAAADDNNTTLSWTDWSLLCAAASSYAGKLTDAELTAFTPFSYPSLSVSEFEGEGTEASPYLIKSLDHLILLADKVNNDTEYVGSYYNNQYTRTYLGKYFALANDIDMSGYRFEPIGSTWSQRFAGVFDGRGHKISGLTVNAASKYYAGLFGMADTVSVLKNVILENPTVSADYYNAGSIVAWTLGSVENVTVYNPVVSTLRVVAAGVAGIVNGSISNCHVEGGTIEGGGYVGGVAGEVHGGMQNCSATGTQVFMTGSGNPGGGVVGNLITGDGENLAFSGLVRYKNTDAQQYLGGVAGMVQVGTLRSSFSAGMVIGYSNQSCVGGVTGLLTGKLVDCYSSGFVHCYSRITGGIVGQVQLGSNKISPEVRNCYTSATVECETYQYNRENCNEVIGKIIDGSNPVLENIYYDSQVTNFYSTRFGALTSDLTSAEGPKGFSADVWNFTKGAYPRIKATAESQAAMYSASAVDMIPSDNFKKLSNNTPITALGNTQFKFLKQGRLYDDGYYASIKDGMIVIGEEFGVDTLYVINGTTQTYHFVNIAPIPFEGDGTVESPFIIKSKADLIAMSQATTVKRQTFPGMYFELGGDIDMEYDTAFLGINADNSAGSASIAFQGVFDGKGHTIDRLVIPDRLVWTTPIEDGKLGTLNASQCRGISGLFGRVGVDGVIRNVNIGANSRLEMYATCAALVGQLDGRVENCRNYADVIGYSCWVGGIVGQMNKGSVVKDCYNAGNITTSYANVGGIAGTTGGVIENCVNTGTIRATNLVTNYSKQLQRAGGISGGSNGGSFINCVNYGNVSADLNNAGGICGSLEGTSTAGSGKDDLTRCFNFGNVYCGNKATLGAIAGIKGTKEISAVYYDVQMIGLKAGANSDMENVTPMETSALISGEAIDGFDTAEWDFAAGMYPAFKMFADEAKVKAARKVYAIIPDGRSVDNLTVSATLSEGAEWSLTDGTIFKIEGNTLIAPEKVDAVVSDTLVAVNEAGVRRAILLNAKPTNPLAGEGTKDSPFLINNTDDWNSLVKYMDGASDGLENQFVKITADLDFAGGSFSRLGADGVTSLLGTIDGDGHEIKGLVIKAAGNNVCALIGTIAAGGSVENIVFSGEASGAYTYVAPVVDKLYGTLRNVKSNFTVTTTKANCAGVVGNAYNGALLDKVVFAGSITSAQNMVGGIVATTQANGRVTFNECAFTGKIAQTSTNTKATAVTVGGLVATCGPSTFTGCYSDGEINISDSEFATNVAGFIGNASGNKTDGLYSFTNCYNATPISAAGKVAGIVAGGPTSSTSAANFQFVMTDCYNTGDITSTATKAVSSSYTAGLIMQYTPGSKFVRCHNEGTIISNKNVYAAGIAGYITGTPGSTSTPATVEFTDCYNEGLIVADGNQGGGITGYVSGAVTLTGCYNTGDIEGNQMLGGITSGFAGTGPKLLNCYNTGNITAKAQRAGGLIAWGAPTNGVVEGCWNTGNISSTSEEQGTKVTSSNEIGGLAGSNAASFINCYNAGTVEGLSRVGGLVGNTTKGKTTFTNCYNAGKIIAPADSCGSIVGISVNNDKQWTEGNAMTDCYYIDSNNCDNDAATSAKAFSVAALAALDLGEGFDSVDDYTFPVVKGFADNNAAMINAAQIVFGGNDTAESVTGSFHVGGAPVVTWSSDCSVLSFNESVASFTGAFTGKIRITATAGELSKEYEIQVSATSGIEDIDASGIEVVDSRYFNAAGIEVAEPSISDGNVYVVVRTLSDGSVKVEKVVMK
ncbi:hypothetical protein [Muribaculum sp.]|uniref:hypothetical protein n=1 Tax=Muribaculum sp. TaxID=1918611 RepID=UPI0023C105EC|nr:hypothetical protein [Muribaculum sp.]MDE5706312.1 hypothetical protein [Muribaculum sp.]